MSPFTAGYQPGMGIGLGIVLLLLGLALVSGAIQYDINFIDDMALGWILLGCGVLALVLTFAMNPRRRREVQEIEEHRVDY